MFVSWSDIALRLDPLKLPLFVLQAPYIVQALLIFFDSSKNNHRRVLAFIFHSGRMERSGLRTLLTSLKFVP
jgi:hypothetical protein